MVLPTASDIQVSPLLKVQESTRIRVIELHEVFGTRLLGGVGSGTETGEGWRQALPARSPNHLIAAAFTLARAVEERIRIAIRASANHGVMHYAHVQRHREVQPGQNGGNSAPGNITGSINNWPDNANWVDWWTRFVSLSQPKRSSSLCVIFFSILMCLR